MNIKDLDPNEIEEVEMNIKDIDPSEIEEDLQEDRSKEAFIEGGIQGLTFHAGDEIASGVEAIAEWAGNSFLEKEMKGIKEDLPTLAESYNAAQQRRKLIRDKLKKDHPAAYLSGDILGTMGSTAATMGAAGVLRGGSIAAKLGAELATSAVHGLGRSEEDTIEGVFKDGVEEGIVGAAFGTVGPLYKGARGITGEAAKSIRAGTFISFLGDNTNKVKDSLKGKSKDVVDWATRMTSYTDETGKAIVTPTISRKELAEKFSTLKDTHWKQMGKILDQVDNDIGLQLSLIHI